MWSTHRLVVLNLDSVVMAVWSSSRVNDDDDDGGSFRVVTGLGCGLPVV